MKLLDCGLLIAVFWGFSGRYQRSAWFIFQSAICKSQSAITSGLLRWILNDYVVDAQRRTSRPLQVSQRLVVISL